ncbi:TPA: hypothetical protein EYO77_11850 [Candidatus Poribacteria bacterium]|nr:hypothetical protein [Candidatus Poribacteria bacterium]
MDFSISRRQISIAIILAFVLFLIVLAINIILRRESEIRLITLLPSQPVGYLSVKELGGLVDTFQHSDFGKAVKQVPILDGIQQKPWWQQIHYQKELWEYEIGAKLDLKFLESYFGRQAILAFYQSEEKLSFLLISDVGAKGILEVSTIVAAGPINSKYERIKSKHLGVTINTITGYPLDFSYAFVDTVGILSFDESLVEDVIKIHVARQPGFVEQSYTDLLERYDSSKNTGYVNFSKILRNVKITPIFKTALTPIKTMTFSNQHKNGMIIFDSRFTLNKPIDLVMATLKIPNGQTFEVEPKQLIADIENFFPILKLIALANGVQLGNQWKDNLLANLAPLETLGTMVTQIQFSDQSATATIKIPLE